MKRYWISVIWLAALQPGLVTAQSSRVSRMPVATYSIVARDSVSGQIGVAVQSHWFSVGPIVPFAEAGVGAVATQSFVDPRYGPLGLALMRAGKSAPEALRGLLETDAQQGVRQVGMVDAFGRVAAHTGAQAIEAAGHIVGEQFSVQANIMESPQVWQDMAEAYRRADGDLAERLLVALEAAEAAGGDLRGRQSAAIVVVRPESSGLPWVDRLFDLRVEDHPEPVAELRRLVTLQRAYLRMQEGDEHLAARNVEAALEAYQAAMEIVPDEATNGEVPFWVGITLADTGRRAEAVPLLRRAYRQDPRWAELVRRLPRAGLLPDESELVEYLIGQMQE